MRTDEMKREGYGCDDCSSFSPTTLRVGPYGFCSAICRWNFFEAFACEVNPATLHCELGYNHDVYGTPLQCPNTDCIQHHGDRCYTADDLARPNRWQLLSCPNGSTLLGCGTIFLARTDSTGTAQCPSCHRRIAADAEAHVHVGRLLTVLKHNLAIGLHNGTMRYAKPSARPPALPMLAHYAYTFGHWIGRSVSCDDLASLLRPAHLRERAKSDAPHRE